MVDTYYTAYCVVGELWVVVLFRSAVSLLIMSMLFIFSILSFVVSVCLNLNLRFSNQGEVLDCLSASEIETSVRAWLTAKTMDRLTLSNPTADAAATTTIPNTSLPLPTTTNNAIVRTPTSSSSSSSSTASITVSVAWCKGKLYLAARNEPTQVLP